MNTYQVILEGTEKEEEGYFITMTVHAESEEHATELALGRAEERGLHVLRVEDIELVDEDIDGKAGVVDIHEREFFDWEEEGYTEREVGEDGELHPVEDNEDDEDDDEYY